MNDTITTILGFAAALGIIVAASIYGSGLSDQANCMKWQTEAAVRPDYYITHWQKEQCDYWKVKISAPVR